MKSNKQKHFIVNVAQDVLLGLCVAIPLLGAISLVATLMHSLSLYVSDRPSPGQDKFYFAKKYAGSFAAVTRKSGNGLSGGSAFVVAGKSGKPYLISNAHVCEAGKDDMHMDASFDDGTRQVSVRILEMLQNVDLCIMEAPFDRAPFAMGDSSVDFDALIIIGHPMLNPLSVEAGHVADVSASIKLPVKAETKEECWGEDGEFEEGSFGPFKYSVCTKPYESVAIFARIFPGNSGSAVFNNAGEVIGVVFASRNDQSMGYMIDVKHLKAALELY